MRDRNAFSTGWAVAAFLCGLLAAAAHPASADTRAVVDPFSRTVIVIEDAWSRETIGRQTTGAVFFLVESRGESGDRLIGAETPAAEAAEIHTHIHEEGVMRMRRLDDLSIPAGGTVRFEPGGHHIMLIGLREPLSDGDLVPLTLVFEEAGPVAISFEVKSLASAPGHGSAPDHGSMTDHGSTTDHGAKPDPHGGHGSH